MEALRRGRQGLIYTFHEALQENGLFVSILAGVVVQAKAMVAYPLSVVMELIIKSRFVM